MLKIQEFINCFDSMEEAATYLSRNLRVEGYRISMEEGYSVWHFKPNQKADFSNPLVREAHCLMTYDDGELLARAWPLPHIATVPEQIPESFELVGSICEEIPDGDIVIVYNIEGEWTTGTINSMDGDDYFPNMQLPTMTYEHEVKALLGRRYQSSWTAPFNNVNPYMCFVFYYVSPYLGKVMPILSPELYLSTIINIESGHELTRPTVVNMADKMDLATTNQYDVADWPTLSKRLFHMRALAPGLMLRDKNDMRVAIPNPMYKAVESAKAAGDRVRPTHMAKIVAASRDKADLVSIGAAYEAYAPMIELLFKVRKELASELYILWNTAKKELNRPKEFAQVVMHHPLNYLLFMFRDGGIKSLADELQKLKPIKLTRLAQQRWEKEYDQAQQTLRFSGGTSNGNVEESYQEEGSEEEDGCIPFGQDGD